VFKSFSVQLLRSRHGVGGLVLVISSVIKVLGRYGACKGAIIVMDYRFSLGEGQRKHIVVGAMRTGVRG
jgi:hypothetical protein